MIYFYLLLCNILFIPFILCSSTPVNKLNSVTPHDSNPSNETRVPLQSEGGSLPPNTLIMALPKETHDIPSLENETKESKSKIVARKGVLGEDISKSQEVPLPSDTKSSTDKPDIPKEKLKIVQSNDKTNNVSVLQNKTVLLKESSDQDSNKTKLIKKPLILNSDILERMSVNSSPETIINDQIQSPNDKKSFLYNAKNNPGMVMPIVITILLVPMFAVLGFMALRRGQEAWKNRHYKRMDFLLDGMYND